MTTGNISLDAQHSKDWLELCFQVFLAHRYLIIGWHECGIDLPSLAPEQQPLAPLC